MANLELDLPVNNNGEFDLVIMQEWTAFQEEIDRVGEDLEKLMA